MYWGTACLRWRQLWLTALRCCFTPATAATIRILRLSLQATNRHPQQPQQRPQQQMIRVCCRTNRCTTYAQTLPLGMVPVLLCSISDVSTFCARSQVSCVIECISWTVFRNFLLTVFWCSVAAFADSLHTALLRLRLVRAFINAPQTETPLSMLLNTWFPTVCVSVSALIGRLLVRPCSAAGTLHKFNPRFIIN